MNDYIKQQAYYDLIMIYDTKIALGNFFRCFTNLDNIYYI